MSSPIRKQLYSQASADHKDFDGFLVEMAKALRTMGVYVVQDPQVVEYDMVGVIFHQGPIDPKALWKQLKKDNPGLYTGRFEDHKQMLTPQAMYELGDLVEFKVDRASELTEASAFEVTKLIYDPLQGWLYTLAHGKPFRDVKESLLTLRAHARQE